MDTKLYREFRTVDELDAEYAIHLAVRDFDGYLRSYRERSERVRSALRPSVNIQYGPTLDETFDLFTPEGSVNPPLVVYIHGGYWCASHKDEWSFVAESLVEAGFAVAIENYSLCPSVSMFEIVRQHRALIAHLYRHSSQYGFRGEGITVAGHSAGAHGAVSLLQTDWETDYGLPPSVIGAVVGISGVYDLRPLPFTFLAPNLQMDAAEALRLSPQLNVPVASASVLLVVGRRETAEFRRQTRDFFGACRDAGLAVELQELPRDHYDIVDDLSETGPIFDYILKRAAPH